MFFTTVSKAVDLTLLLGTPVPQWENLYLKFIPFYILCWGEVPSFLFGPDMQFSMAFDTACVIFYFQRNARHSFHPKKEAANLRDAANSVLDGLCLSGCSHMLQ